MASQKEVLIEKLKGLGVELSGEESLSDLKKLDVNQETDGEESDDEGEAEEAGSEDQVTVGFIDPMLGQTERVFSKEIHGKDFKKIAKEFVETHAEKQATIL